MKKTLFKTVKYFSLVLVVMGIFLLSFEIQKINAAEVYPFDGIIHADAAVIHVNSSLSSAEATQLIYGSKVTVVASSSSSVYQITYDNGKTGYVAKSLVTNMNNNKATSNIAGIETYEVYCNSLKTQGFHESYCPYLYYLHSKHPTWIFKADVIDHTLDEVATKEVEYTSLQTDNKNYHVIDVNGNSLVNEYSSGGNYYFLNADAIKSLIDPRNSLYENTIFQFINLEKNTDAVNDAALAKIVGTGNLSNYYAEFKKAGNSLGINTIHLIARSRQEGANTVGYSATTGTYSVNSLKKKTVNNVEVDVALTSSQGYSLDGYYNFYNIGSYISGYYTSTVQRGLAYGAGFLAEDKCMTEDTPEEAYASYYYYNGTDYVKGVRKAHYDVEKCGPLEYQRPWNTPEKAVLGGGEFIGNMYVKKGQNTLFFQKYNISSYTTQPLFRHQYMTNGYAPKSEGDMMKSAYVGGSLLETGFEFVIPVYKNMTNDLAGPVNKSSNNKLSSIKVNNTLITGFNSEVVEYNYNLITNENSFDITADVIDSKSKVQGTGKVNFVNDVATVNIVVTAENGSKNTYVVTVKKVIPEAVVKVSDILSKLAVKVNDKYIYGISPGTSVTSIIQTITTNKGSASIVDVTGKAKGSGNLATGDKITIIGTNENITYTISVRGDINGNGTVKIVDLILLQSHILGNRKLVNENFYAADVNYDGNLKINDLILIQSHILEKIML